MVGQVCLVKTSFWQPPSDRNSTLPLIVEIAVRLSDLQCKVCAHRFLHEQEVDISTHCVLIAKSCQIQVCCLPVQNCHLWIGTDRTIRLAAKFIEPVFQSVFLWFQFVNNFKYLQDSITAYNGEMKNTLEGKAEMSTATTSAIFAILEHAGIKTSLIQKVLHFDFCHFTASCGILLYLLVFIFYVKILVTWQTAPRIPACIVWEDIP